MTVFVRASRIVTAHGTGCDREMVVNTQSIDQGIKSLLSMSCMQGMRLKTVGEGILKLTS